MKKTSVFELTLPLRDPAVPAFLWLYRSLRGEILEGRLRPGMRIPGTRDLAHQHGLSRGTIVTAFEQLKSEGYLEGSVGSGTYVSKVLPEELLQVSRPAGIAPAPARSRKRSLSGFGSRVRLFSGYEMRPTRAFRSNLPALDLFPAAVWTQISMRRSRRMSTFELMGCESMGYLPLREAVAGYLATRGVKCTAAQIAIVSGVQEALDLSARMLLDPGDRVCMEEPGYVGASIVFDAVGARVSGVPVDESGMKVPGRALRGTRLAYITPGHQFPLGITMSLPRRLQLLEWARRQDALIFEDDYDSEFRYASRPLPALQGLDRHGLVLFSGTFSKVLFPSLRLGYLVVPPDLVDAFAAAKSVTTRHAPLLDQAVLCDFITGGHFARHLRRMREVYAERLSVLLESASRRLAGLLEISGVEAGLQTAGWLAEGLDEDAAARAAADRNVEVTPLRHYWRGRPQRAGLHLGFAAVDAREIRRGVTDLAIALESCLKRCRAGSSRAVQSRSPNRRAR